METVQNGPPEREPRDIRHFADLASTHTACGLERAAVRWTDDPATPVDCPACQPLPTVADWAASTEAELEQRLRDSAAYVDQVLGGMDAATEAARDLVQLLPEPVHYDPGTLERLTLCDLNVPELAPEDVTTDPAQATCPTCTRGLVDSQLPSEPAADPITPEVYAEFFPERNERRAPLAWPYEVPPPSGFDPGPDVPTSAAPSGPRCGVHLAPLGSCTATEVPCAPEFFNELTGILPGYVAGRCGHRVAGSEWRAGFRVCERCPDEAPPAAPERRTVGLEVLTDALRREYGKTSDDPVWGGAVAVVARVNGEAIDVPEIDTLWAAPYRKAPDILAQMLRQARMYADGLDGQAGAELLMPGPEVLATLAGQPDLQPWTERLTLRADQIKPGWLAVDFHAEGVEDVIEEVRDCQDLTCSWYGNCVVIVAELVEPVHFANWHDMQVRIPAATR